MSPFAEGGYSSSADVGSVVSMTCALPLSLTTVKALGSLTAARFNRMCQKFLKVVALKLDVVPTVSGLGR